VWAYTYAVTGTEAQITKLNATLEKIFNNLPQD